MSNIYIQEPPTNGKVLLETTVGDIDIELWSKEAPKACRNFVQLCMEGYYDGTIFHRIIKDFIAQGGDPTGTGEGGESIYGQPFKDEIHTRLRFVRRGLVAMANAGPNDNGSQFFFTLDKAPELQNKHTIFGKVTGNTIYNMIKLQDCETDGDDRPLYPPKINKTKILSNPFDDIEPRTVKNEKSEENKIKSKSKGTKNFKLLSFGEEAEENEEEDLKVSQVMKGKSKSSHDLTNDPTLSTEIENLEERTKVPIDDEDTSGKVERAKEVADKLKERGEQDKKRKSKIKEETTDDDDKDTNTLDELRKEAKKLKRELLGKNKKPEEIDQSKMTEKSNVSEVVESYMKERQKYQDMKKTQGKKGSDREAMTLDILSKFQSKLNSAKLLAGDYSEEEEEMKDEEPETEEKEEEDPSDLSWMRHKLKFMNEEKKRKVIDANVEELDRYEIHDPRNPLTKRRREASKQAMKGKR